MTNLISLVISSIAFAGEGEGHTHGPTEHMGPVVIALVVLVILGAVFHFKTKKK